MREKHLLTIDRRHGNFPGMLRTRTFRIVLVGEGRGTGVEVTANPDKVVAYKGQKLIVRLR
jgi:alpha-D-xyloside xylohydrolase